MILFLSLAACHNPKPEAVDSAYRQEILQWRNSRMTRLQAPDGWLSLAGLCWLEAGENNMGNDPGCSIPLLAPGIPEKAGIIKLEGDRIRLLPAKEAGISLKGKAVEAPLELSSDADPKGPDILQIGRIQAYLIRRGDKFAMRIKDPQAATRTQFRGIDYFPIDPEFRVKAILEPYTKPLDVSISTAVGIDEHMLCPGILRFTLKGTQLELLPWIDKVGQTELFIVFRDATSGQESYGAGRFLSAQLNEEGEAILDFNQAFSPPCAFTPYATCPLAPPENELPIAVTAGEKLVHGGTH